MILSHWEQGDDNAEISSHETTAVDFDNAGWTWDDDVDQDDDPEELVTSMLLDGQISNTGGNAGRSVGSQDIEFGGMETGIEAGIACSTAIPQLDGPDKEEKEQIEQLVEAFWKAVNEETEF